MKKWCERTYPYIVALSITAIYSYVYQYVGFDIKAEQFAGLLNMSIALSGISLGFIGTMIGAFLAITNSAIMEKIYKNKADEDFMRYILESFGWGVVLFVGSTGLLLAPLDKNATVPLGWIVIWLFIFMVSTLCSYRIVQMLFVLLYTVNKENKHNLMPAAITIKKHKSSQFKKPEYKDNPYDD